MIIIYIFIAIFAAFATERWNSYIRNKKFNKHSFFKYLIFTSFLCLFLYVISLIQFLNLNK